MASVNKKFAVEKGLEVGDDALVVDAQTNKTGIGKTVTVACSATVGTQLNTVCSRSPEMRLAI